MSRVTSDRYPIVLAAVAILGLAAVATAAILHAIWRDGVEDASASVATVATVLAEQTAQSVRAVDLVLDALVVQIEGSGIETADELRQRLGTEESRTGLTERLGRLSQVQAIAIADASGDTVVTTRAWPTPAANIAERDHFRQLRDHGGQALAVGPPVRNIADGDWTVYFGRRLENRAGDFLGIVSIGVPPSFFLNIAEGISDLDGYQARLLREDGTIYVVNPPEEQQLGVKTVEASEWHALVATGGGTFRAAAKPDRPARLVAVEPIADYPLVVDVAFGEAGVIALWRERALSIGLISAGLALGMAALVAALIAQLQRALGQQEQLRERDDQLRLEAHQRQAADARFEAAIGHMRQGLAVFGADMRLVTCNRAFLEMYGIKEQEAPPGTPLRTILDLRIARGVYYGTDTDAYARERTALGANPDLRETTDVHAMRDGRFFRLSKQVLPDGGWLAVHEDVTEREKTLAHLRHLASHDPLTELGNRSLLFDRLRTLTPSDPGAGCAGLLLADLDGFKSINDRFGHSIGDELLRAVALRLRSLATDTDTVSRLGGDEFALLRPCEPNGLSGLVALGGRVIEALQEPFDIPPHRLKVGASIGIAASFGEPASPDAILRQADLALYHAKFEGRNRVAVFKPAMEIAVGYRRDLAQDLDIALDAEVITLDFQPVVNVDTGAVVVMEALARWRHPDLGPIAPSTFVPIAEEYGLVHKLGDAVFAAACRAAATWPASVRIAINVSALQVTQDTLPEVFRRHIDRAGLSAERVDLEITESALLSKDSRVIECLKDLRSMGAKIVLDDFGTGFASLSNLNTFTVDRIKIDRSFIARLGSHRGSTAIVEASTMIADAFNVMVTAEGVETEQQRAVLRALGVSQQQGYLFARPAPLAAWSFIEGRAVRTDAAPAPA